MDDRAKLLAGSIAGAAVGMAVAYLYFTPRGRSLRRDIEPLVDELVRELGKAHAALKRLRDELADDGPRDRTVTRASWPTRPA